MSWPATRQKNSSQRPGLIILEGKQKRRTSEQKQADDMQAQIKKLEKLTVEKEGLERVVNLIDRAVQEEESVLTNRPKPWLCIIVKPPVNLGHKLSSPLSLLETEPGSTVADLGSGSFQAVGEFLGDGQDEEVQEDEPDDNSETDRSDGAPQPSQWRQSAMWEQEAVESAGISEGVKSAGISGCAVPSMAGQPEKVMQHSVPW